MKKSVKFLLTHPVWDVTNAIQQGQIADMQFLLTHPVWDVTRCFNCHDLPVRFLLTHPVWDVTY